MKLKGKVLATGLFLGISAGFLAMIPTIHHTSVGGNSSNRSKKYRRGNQNGDSDGENLDGRAKTVGVANFKYEKIGYFNAGNVDETQRRKRKNPIVGRRNLS